jgi:hypothetical protein
MAPSALSSFSSLALKEQASGSEFFVHFERGLNPRIRQIRPALDDDADKLRYIET